MSLFESINCICCGKEITLFDLDIDDYINNDKKLDQSDPSSFMWNGGVVEKMSAGFGSINDGDVFYIGICDNCIKDNYKNGRLIYKKNYMGFKRFTKDELKEFEKLKRRESNLNKLI
jgi:hypothetical protein